jgi:ribosome-associated protein
MVAVQNNPENNDDQVKQPSKTRRKKEMHALQDIGEQLVALDIKQLNELDLPETLMDAILDAKQIQKHGAYRRQMQYIGKLMRNIDVLSFQEKLAIWQNLKLQQTARQHLLEHWRDRLLSDEKAFTEFSQKYPAADIQRLRMLMRKTHKEKFENKQPRSFRALFHELQAIISDVDKENS